MISDETRRLARSFEFGPYTLFPERQLLLRDGRSVCIGGRALDLLTVLAERPGELVGKRELLSRVWPETTVEESNLKVNIASLRRVLEGGSGSAPYIATIVGRGYKFVVPVRSVFAALPSSDDTSSTRASHNLPTLASGRIIGRQECISTLRQDLEETALISLVGPGGIGKTTVAIAVAEHFPDRCRDGVWLVDLSSLKNGNLVANAIATVIGLAAHSSNMTAALAEYLRTTEMLLVLDSCEHVIDGVAAVVESILATAREVRILATSREALRVRTERVRRLPGLESPDPDASLGAEAAMAFPAVQLFVDRAADKLETFSLSDADVPAVVDICRKLDGIALAIELAATRVDVFSIAELRRQLDDRLRPMLSQRSGAERHRTLAATIDWSFELLQPVERTVLCRLAVFAKSFSLDSACAVATDPTLEPGEVVDAVAGLVSKSLAMTEMHGDGLLYRLLDTTRAYALKKLAARDEFESVRHRHAEHCMELLIRAGSDIERLSRADWISRYGPLTDDVRDAMRWAFKGSSDASLGVRLTVAAIPFGKQVSLVDECRIAVERALDERYRAYRNLHDDAILNLTLGATLLHIRGPLKEVKTALMKAFEIAETMDDAGLQMACLKGLSEYELWTGDSRAAMSVSERIRALEGKGQKAAAADADAQAGAALSWIGALGAARCRLEGIVQKPLNTEHSAEAARFEFDQRLIARGALATVLWLQGFPDQALATARQQLQDAEASNYAVSLCSALLHGSAMIAMYVRDYPAARSFMDRGIEHARRHGLTIWTAMVTGGGARLNLYLGQPLDLAHLRENLAEVREGGFRLRYPNYLTNFGEALARQGNLEGGLAAIDEAVAICMDTGQIVGIPEILRIKGNVIRFQSPDRWESGVDCYRQSIELAKRDGALSWELRSAISLASLLRQHGGSLEAEDALAETYGRFSEGFSSGDLRRARHLIENAPRF